MWPFMKRFFIFKKYNMAHSIQISGVINSVRSSLIGVKLYQVLYHEARLLKNKLDNYTGQN